MKTLLGILDLICILPLIFIFVGGMGTTFPAICAAYLIIKGILFLTTSKDYVSILDIIIGIYIMITIFDYASLIISGLSIIWLLQKAIFSFI